MNLHAIVHHFLSTHFGVEQVEVVDRVGDFLDGGLIIVCSDQFGADGSNLHHDCLRTELLEALTDLILRGEVLHEVEQLEDVLRVALDGLVILKLEVANAAVMILDGFLLEFGAFVGADGEVVVLAAVFLTVLFEADQEVVQQGGVPKRPLTVRAKLGVHLQQAEVDPQLQLIYAILIFDPARIHPAEAVVPVFEDS